VLPTALWLVLTYGWRKSVSRLAAIGAAAIVVAAPWLIHTTRTWGSPLRSDLDLLMSAHVDSWRYGDEFVRASHLPTPPPPVTQVLRQQPRLFAVHSAQGARAALRELVRGAADSSYLAAALLALIALLVAFRSPGVWRHPVFLAALAYIALFTAAMSPGGKHTEARYWALIYLVFAAALVTGLFRLGAEFRAGHRGWLHVGALTLASLYLAVSLTRSDYRMARFALSVNPQRRDFIEAASLINRTIAKGAPVVVGHYPYYYTAATGAQALSIPASSDDFLFSYMRKYHAGYVFLSREELDFWRPSWSSGRGPAFLQPIPAPPGYYLYRFTGT
jgi:hypothetical protein